MAASGSLPKAADTTGVRPFGLPRDARLRTARDFEALRDPHFRASSRWTSLAARIEPAPVEDCRMRIRVGVIAGKRMARKATQRNLMKRILREAARHARPQLEAAAGARRVDFVLRIRSAFPEPGDLSLAAFKRQLRAEADALLRRLVTHLAAQP